MHKTWGDNDIYYRKLTYYEGLTVVEDLSGNRTEYHHDDGVVYKTVDPKGGISLTVRNETGDIIQETDEEGLTTTYSYDERGNLLGVVNPNGSAVSYTYENDIAIAATDAGGGNWIWIRNEEGKVVQQINPIGLITQYEYTNGLLTAVIRNDGARTEILYDQQFNVAELRLPDGNSSSWTFDALGRCIEYTDVYGGTQFRRFDNLGRVIEITEVDGNKIFFKYNGEGEVIHVKDKVREVEFEYQGMGKMAQRKENNTKLEFIYDKEEQLIGIRNEKGTPYNFKLDPLGNVTEEIGFDGIKKRFARDKAGKVTSVQRPDNKITKYEYDDGGRITKVIQHDDLTEIFTYDLAGNLVEAANDNILLKFERDKLGRVKKERQGDFITESLFDDKGTRVGLKSSAGANIRIDRNVMGDVSAMSATNGDSTWEAKLQSDEMGLEVLRELPGGLQSRWQRDKLGRPLEHVVTKGKTLHRSRQYLWDYDDRLKKMIDQIQGETQFGHDAVGNLTWAKYNDGFIEYRIADETGNYYKTKDKSDRKFGPAGQILESRNTKFEYDAEGNLIRKLLKDGKEWQYQWYSNGMLKRSSGPTKRKYHSLMIR
ncbi:MAG: RHS repeat protein [Bacteroidetes bacterium]|nr:RHS repeat protein [Bacteroidota bacterium]